MKIAVIGAGYVGLVSAACLAEFGATIVCVDQDPARIAMLQSGVMPIFEPGLEAQVAKVVKAGTLQFTTAIEPAVEAADAVFIAVGTPSRRGDGHADLRYVYAAVRTIARCIKDYTVVIMKSTVPVGTAREVGEIIREVNPDADFDVCSNPEFLREGSAIEDFMRPNRIIVGCESERARHVIQRIYRPLFLLDTPFVFSNLESAELTKYASNAFLAMKVTFMNEIADLCEASGADVQSVAAGVGLDGRIGKKFLHAGPGYGGSCFPKDTAALLYTANDLNVPMRMVETTIAVNRQRKLGMAHRVIAACGGSVAGKTIAILGLTFKPNTDDMRDSVSLDVIPLLQKAKATIRAYDPEGMEEAKKLLSDVTWTTNAYDALENVDAVVVLTEWNEFRSLDLKRVHALMRVPIFIDLRNIYKPEEMATAGFTYSSIGRVSQPLGEQKQASEGLLEKRPSARAG